MIEAAGFEGARNAEEQPIAPADEALSPHMSGHDIAAFRTSGVGLQSVTVLAAKPIA